MSKASQSGWELTLWPLLPRQLKLARMFTLRLLPALANTQRWETIRSFIRTSRLAAVPKWAMTVLFTLTPPSTTIADGFGFAPTSEGYEKIPQIGITILEDHVEIGANTCVDRATMGATIVHSGVKLDNLIQVAHNDEIGSHTVMAAQVGVAGSTKIGEWCMFGGQVGIAGHIHIGNKVNLGAQSGVPSSIKDGSQLIGTPPMELKQYFKASIAQRSLPEMQVELRQLRKELNELKQLLNK